MRATFQDELNLLESTLHEEGALVLRALRGALNALEQRDQELADEVIAFDDDVDPVEVRRRIGMVFQRANPFPKSIYDNVAWGPRVLGMKKGLDERVEKALTDAALWNEVKDRLKKAVRSATRAACCMLCVTMTSV